MRADATCGGSSLSFGRPHWRVRPASLRRPVTQTSEPARSLNWSGGSRIRTVSPSSSHVSPARSATRPTYGRWPSMERISYDATSIARPGSRPLRTGLPRTATSAPTRRLSSPSRSPVSSTVAVSLCNTTLVKGTFPTTAILPAYLCSRAVSAPTVSRAVAARSRSSGPASAASLAPGVSTRSRSSCRVSAAITSRGVSSSAGGAEGAQATKTRATATPMTKFVFTGSAPPTSG
jgi:hypothetical protein